MRSSRFGGRARGRQTQPRGRDGRLWSDRPDGGDLVERLSDIPLSHLQLVRAPNDLAGTPIQVLRDTIGYYRSRFKGTLIANGGFDKATADAAIASDHADLVSFASFFIGNPDLVRRLRDDIPLSASSRETYYQGGAGGYLDYPVAS